MSVVRRFISIFVLASLPLATNASLAHSFHYDPSAPSFLKTPPTGTGFGVPLLKTKHFYVVLPQGSILLA